MTAPQAATTTRLYGAAATARDMTGHNKGASPPRDRNLRAMWAQQPLSALGPPHKDGGAQNAGSCAWRTLAVERFNRERYVMSLAEVWRRAEVDEGLKEQVWGQAEGTAYDFYVLQIGGRALQLR